MLCSGLTNEIQCLIVITRKDLALRTKTNQQASSNENRMEVRLVTAASRGFFSLSRGSRSRLRRSQSQLRYEKKCPLAPRVVIDRLPFLIYMLFTGSLFRFTCYLQAPFFDLYDVYRLPFSIYMLFTGSLFRFTCCSQAPFFDLHVVHRLPFSIYMLLACYLQYFDNLPALNLHVFYGFYG